MDLKRLIYPSQELRAMHVGQSPARDFPFHTSKPTAKVVVHIALTFPLDLPPYHFDSFSVLKKSKGYNRNLATYIHIYNIFTTASNASLSTTKSFCSSIWLVSSFDPLKQPNYFTSIPLNSASRNPDSLLCFFDLIFAYLARMRAPSLLKQCLPGLAPHDRVAQSMSIASDKEIHLPSPAVEILPSKMGYPYRYAGESIDWRGVNLFKGRVSVSDIIDSELISSKHDASLKSWDSSFDLVNILKHEIRDGQLSFRGKRVLELSCGYGIPGIFACLKGASTVHFQDLNAETIRRTTIPNVLVNLEQARDRQSRQPESPLTPSRQILSPMVHFYAGQWEELAGVLSVVKNNVLEVPPPTNLSFSEEDFMDGLSSHDGSIMGQENSSRRSTRLSGSRVWERANDTDIGGGYDVILVTDIPHSATSLKKLYALIKKCLKPPYGVLFVATKKHYVGFNSAVRQLRSLVDEEGIFGAHLVKETTDTEVWKFFLK